MRVPRVADWPEKVWADLEVRKKSTLEARTPSSTAIRRLFWSRKHLASEWRRNYYDVHSH